MREESEAEADRRSLSLPLLSNRSLPVGATGDVKIRRGQQVQTADLRCIQCARADNLLFKSRFLISLQTLISKSLHIVYSSFPGSEVPLNLMHLEVESSPSLLFTLFGSKGILTAEERASVATPAASERDGRRPPLNCRASEEPSSKRPLCSPRDGLSLAPSTKCHKIQQ